MHKHHSIGVEFADNHPDVAKPASAEQIAAWSILVRMPQARHGEGCDLATLAHDNAFPAKP